MNNTNTGEQPSQEPHHIDPKTLDLSGNIPKKKPFPWTLVHDQFDATQTKRAKKVSSTVTGVGSTGKADALPRFDLREGPFRKYEDFIAEACAGSYMAKPFEGQSASTFCYRFRDAVLGYRRYKYPSKKIPAGADLSAIKAIPLVNGQVEIQNEIKDRENKERRKAREAAEASTQQSTIPDTEPVKPATLAVEPEPVFEGIPPISNRSAWRRYIEEQVELAFSDADNDGTITFEYTTPEDRAFVIETTQSFSPPAMAAFLPNGKVKVSDFIRDIITEDLPDEDVFGRPEE